MGVFNESRNKDNRILPLKTLKDRYPYTVDIPKRLLINEKVSFSQEELSKAV